jgi:hypothetical protein
MSDGGKGSRPRPYSVSQAQFGDNWDAIFKKKKHENGDQRITKEGKLEEYHDGTWIEKENNK